MNPKAAVLFNEWFVCLSVVGASLLISVSSRAQSYQLTPYDQKMYEVYKESYQLEISDSQWQGYISNLSERTYTVTAGDTLWDLSLVFFGDGHFWPKIWSFNERLTNPHLLEVGQRISFFSGSLDQAPTATLIDAKTDEVLVVDVEKMAPEIQEESLYPGTPGIPIPLSRPKKILKNLPSSFRLSAQARLAGQFDENGMSFDIRPPVRVNPLVLNHSFLYGQSHRKYPRLGNVLESENKNLLVDENQYIYIRAENSLPIGGEYSIMGRDYRFDRNGFTGDVIRYMGRVKITRQVEDDVYRGLVVKILDGLHGEPWISEETIPTSMDDYQGRTLDKVFQVIGGGTDESSLLYGQGDIVFLSGGAEDGVRRGDIFAIYKRRDTRFSSTTVDKNPVPIAHVKVFRAEPQFLSAYIMDSEEPVRPGDETGLPLSLKQ